LVSPAGADEAEQPGDRGWELADGLPTWERELVATNLEEIEAMVGAKGRISMMV